MKSSSMLRSTQKNSVSIAQCSHAHSNHVRNVALQRVACEYHSFNLLTTTQVSFGEKIAADCCESKSLGWAYVGSGVISVAETSCG